MINSGSKEESQGESTEKNQEKISYLGNNLMPNLIKININEASEDENDAQDNNMDL